MKKRGIILPVLVSLVPFCLIVLSIIDMAAVLKGNNEYPFSSEFFGKFSIYNSKSAYLIFNVIYTWFLYFRFIMHSKANGNYFVSILDLE